jgi:tetratricopeptide (TPR) repeat protein
MRGYSTREASQLVGLSAERVRAFARSGLIDAERDERRRYRFSFRDIVLMRAAGELEAASIHPRRIRSALKALKARLPERQPLTGVRISSEGDRVVVREQGHTWRPESGQTTFDFSVSDFAREAAPVVVACADEAEEDVATTADDWFLLGLDLESVGEADRAIVAYSQAVALQAHHTEANINLGRLLHDAGGTEDAENCYRAALVSAPAHPTALYNLGVALEDQARFDDAIYYYRRTLEHAPSHADAHYNLARLYERIGDGAAAFRHLRQYRDLTRQPHD